MRQVLTHREQYELTAPWRTAGTRRLAFDWQEASGQPCRTCGWNHPSQILRKAPLENGHELHAWTWGDHPGPEKLGWSWAIIDPSKYPEEPNKHSPHSNVELAGNGGDAGRQGEPGHVNFIPTFDHARAQAEEHYKKLFPIGTDTGSHDSGVDYSDLNAFMRESGHYTPPEGSDYEPSW